MSNVIKGGGGGIPLPKVSSRGYVPANTDTYARMINSGVPGVAPLVSANVRNKANTVASNQIRANATEQMDGGPAYVPATAQTYASTVADHPDFMNTVNPDIQAAAMRIIADRNAGPPAGINPTGPSINANSYPGGYGGPGGGSNNPEAASGIVPVGIEPTAAPVPRIASAIPTATAPPPPPAPEETAGGEAGGVGEGVTSEGRGGIYGNLFQNTNRRNPRNSLSMTSDQLRKSAASRLGL